MRQRRRRPLRVPGSSVERRALPTSREPTIATTPRGLIACARHCPSNRPTIRSPPLSVASPPPPVEVPVVSEVRAPGADCSARAFHVRGRAGCESAQSRRYFSATVSGCDRFAGEVDNDRPYRVEYGFGVRRVLTYLSGLTRRSPISIPERQSNENLTQGCEPQWGQRLGNISCHLSRSVLSAPQSEGSREACAQRSLWPCLRQRLHADAGRQDNPTGAEAKVDYLNDRNSQVERAARSGRPVPSEHRFDSAIQKLLRGSQIDPTSDAAKSVR